MEFNPHDLLLVHGYIIAPGSALPGCSEYPFPSCRWPRPAGPSSLRVLIRPSAHTRRCFPPKQTERIPRPLCPTSLPGSTFSAACPVAEPLCCCPLVPCVSRMMLPATTAPGGLLMPHYLALGRPDVRRCHRRLY